MRNTGNEESGFDIGEGAFKHGSHPQGGQQARKLSNPNTLVLFFFLNTQ
jgi:hypothetical protein